MASGAPTKKASSWLAFNVSESFRLFRAGEEIRTLDVNLGNVTPATPLYTQPAAINTICNCSSLSGRAAPAFS